MLPFVVVFGRRLAAPAASGPGARAIGEAGQERRVIEAAFASYRRADGAVHLDNTLRFVVGKA